MKETTENKLGIKINQGQTTGNFEDKRYNMYDHFAAIFYDVCIQAPYL